MTFTTIAHPQVRHRDAFVFQAADAAGHHFAHAREVIDACHGLDDKLPVIALVRATVLERHQARHGIRTGQMGNIHALDAERSFLEPEHFLQFKNATIDFAVLLDLGAHFHENHVGVRGGKFQEPELFATLRIREHDLVIRLRRKRLFHRFAFRQIFGQGHIRRDFAGNEFHVHVPLHHHLAENFSLVVFELAFQAVMAAPAKYAVAVLENHRGSHRAVPLQRNHVHAEACIGHVGFLVRARRLERLNRIALFRRRLEIHAFARFEHFAFPEVNQVVALAAQEHLRLRHLLTVFFARHKPGTRSAATPDVVIEARPYRPIDGQLELAFANLKQASRDILQLADHTRTHVRAVIQAAVLLHGPAQKQARERFVHGERQVRKMLVVLLEHIVLGRMLPDEVRFQDERFRFAFGDNPLDVADIGQHEGGRTVPRMVAPVKVARHAVLEHLRLAYIYNLALGVSHDVNPRQERKLCQATLDMFTNRNHAFMKIVFIQ